MTNSLCNTLTFCGVFLAEFREAEPREREGYHVMWSGSKYYVWLCGYDKDPVEEIKRKFPEQTREFICTIVG
jgi:hypothetical protein